MYFYRGLYVYIDIPTLRYYFEKHYFISLYIDGTYFPRTFLLMGITYWVQTASLSKYYFGESYLRISILMGRLLIYSYKKERLYLCSDIRSRGAKKYSLSFLTKLWIQNWAPSICKYSIDSFHNNSKKTHLRITLGALFITTVLNHKREGT